MTDPSRPIIISVIIAARPGQEAVSALDRLQGWPDAEVGIEVLIARGRQPSRQRNEAAAQAAGEILYFLDDDSLAPLENIQILLRHFEREDVGVVGGPSLCPGDADESQKLFATVMGDGLAFGPSRSRYLRLGHLRESGEKELILCNLAVRKSLFCEAGGLDESLYPNEENALLDTFAKMNRIMLYDPDFVVERYPRRTLRSFVFMVHTYGKGRGEQILRHPTTGSILNLAPPLLVLYAMATPFIPLWMKLPWLIYSMVVGFHCLLRPYKRKHLVALLLVLTHFSYGMGLLSGLLSPRWKKNHRIQFDVNVEKKRLS